MFVNAKKKKAIPFKETLNRSEASAGHYLWPWLGDNGFSVATHQTLVLILYYGLRKARKTTSFTQVIKT